MKYTAFILCLFITGSVLTNTNTFWGFEEEDDVMVLTGATFEDAIKKYENVLVVYYAPWCGHSQELMPEFSAAAKILKKADPPVPLAKIDATHHVEVTNKYQVLVYPTIKFYYKGNFTDLNFDFDGGRTTEEIVRWVRKKTGPVSELIHDSETLEKRKRERDIVVAYFGEDNEHFKTFIRVAQVNHTNYYVHALEGELVEGNSKIVLYKHFEELEDVYDGDFSFDSIKSFIDTYRFPVVMHFEGDKAIERVFKKELPTVFLFTNDNSTEEIKQYREAALQARGKIIFAQVGVKDRLGDRLVDFFGFKESDAPTIWAINPKPSDLLKYPMKEKITKDSILTFIDHFYEEKLHRHMKSQEIPVQDENEAVVEVVAKNFEEVVLSPGRHVLVMFYAPWCGHSKRHAPDFEAAAKALAGNEKYLFVRIDPSENDIPGINIEGFPTFRFYHAERKDSPMEFQGERNKEGFFKFLMAHAAEDWIDL